ncbi:MAG: phosphohistidine phosphatase SixA [Betaproteobacteria bacterium]|nr:phosphohistidine phosphatase SixA [Betaproteobacteria bacterium]
MDLILWRHADAEDGLPDPERKLTPKGRKQAERVAEWLRQRLPGKHAVLASPAARAQQTAEALLPNFKTVPALAPGARPKDILDAAGWPEREGTVVVVGHQPDLGRAAAYLIAGAAGSVSVKKGGLWWIASRTREEGNQTIVRAVISPDLL